MAAVVFFPRMFIVLGTPRRSGERMSREFSREEWLEPPDVKVCKSLAAEVG